MTSIVLFSPAEPNSLHSEPSCDPDASPNAGEHIHQDESTHPITAEALSPLPGLNGLKLLGATPIQLWCVTAGAFGATGVVMATTRWAPGGSTLQRMFDTSRLEMLIPIAAMVMFFYGLALLFQRGSRVRALRRIAGHEQATELAGAVQTHGLQAIAEWLEQTANQSNPLARRGAALMRQWSLQPGRTEAELALAQHAESERESMQAAYAWIGTIVWALPVIGLMATVYGISTAVDGFSGFLAGDIDNIGAIKHALVGVTGGLGFAFMLTLQGLVCAVVLMFRSAATQRQEERYQADLQEWLTDLVLPAVQRAQPMQPQGGTTDSSEASAAANAILLDETKAWAARQFALATEERLASAAQARATAEALSSAGQSAASAIMDGAALVGRTTAESMAASRLEAASLVDAMVQQAAQLHNALQVSAEAQAKQQAAAFEAMSSSMKSQFTAIVETAAETREVAAVLLQAAQVERESLAAMRDSGIGESLKALVRQIEAQVMETQRTGEQLATLAEGTRALTESHGGVQQGILALEGMSLRGTLADLGSSLNQLRPVLEHFQRPFVLTAVPAMAVDARAN